MLESDRIGPALFLIPVLLVGGLLLIMPDQLQFHSAIGSVDGLSNELRRAFASSSSFSPLRAPGENDWLAVHDEPGQTFDQFVRSRPNRPEAARKTIFLQPLNHFPVASSPSLESLRLFAQAFFGLETTVLPPLSIDDSEIRSRQAPYTGGKQLLTGDVLRLLRSILPDDAYCLLGVTMDDLYPGESWNFVFGQASLRERVAIFSFARYDPGFYAESQEDGCKVLFSRSAKVLAHETAHMFGLHHCIHFDCLMNGSNHLDEADSRPFHLCPVDLRKLQWSVGFDVAERYEELAEAYLKQELRSEAQWAAQRARQISGS